MPFFSAMTRRSIIAVSLILPALYIGMEQFDFFMIKPSHYDDGGYPIVWWRTLIPSNSLAAVNGFPVADHIGRRLARRAARVAMPSEPASQSAEAEAHAPSEGRIPHDPANSPCAPYASGCGGSSSRSTRPCPAC